MKYTLLIIVALCCAFSGNAQVGLAGGYTFAKPFSSAKAYNGLHFGIEVPRDDESSIHGRLTISLPNRRNDSLQAVANDNTTSPPYVVVKNRISQSYFGIEGGTRRYIGNGYDYGFSGYGGTVFNLAVYTIKNQLIDDIDRSKYSLFTAGAQPLDSDKGSLLLLNLGLQGGVKYNMYFGMVYMDVSLCYSILGAASNTFASEYYSGSPLLFTVNVGIRKELFGTL